MLVKEFTWYDFSLIVILEERDSSNFQMQINVEFFFFEQTIVVDFLSQNWTNLDFVYKKGEANLYQKLNQVTFLRIQTSLCTSAAAYECKDGRFPTSL